MAVNRILTSLAFLAIALPACGGHGYVYYGGGYYSGVRPLRIRHRHVLYATGAQVAAAPIPQPVAQPTNAVNGSDGTFGWRVGTQNAEDELRRLSESASHAGCSIESTAPTETRALCRGGTSVLIRSDACDVYKLCQGGTRADVCAATWAHIGR